MTAIVHNIVDLGYEIEMKGKGKMHNFKEKRKITGGGVN